MIIGERGPRRRFFFFFFSEGPRRKATTSDQQERRRSPTNQRLPQEEEEEEEEEGEEGGRRREEEEPNRKKSPRPSPVSSSVGEASKQATSGARNVMHSPDDPEEARPRRHLREESTTVTPDTRGSKMILLEDDRRKTGIFSHMYKKRGVVGNQLL